MSTHAFRDGRHENAFAGADGSAFELVSALRRLGTERRPGPAPVALRLDGNEGLLPDAEVFRAFLAADPEILRRYPDPRPLEQNLAARFGVDPEQVMVTAGADEALDRFTRVALCPGRAFILPSPTFEMLPRYAILSGAETIAIPWMHDLFPIDRVLAAITPQTAAVAFVTPQNPTGTSATAADLDRLCAALPHGLVICDFAYAEYTDHDLTAHALTKSNAVVFRTFSKAWGLAGARIGYVLGPVQILNAMRAAGSPFATNALGLALAAHLLDHGETAMRCHVARIKVERIALTSLIRRLGGEAHDSFGNFVLAHFPNATHIRTSLHSRGIAVREWPTRPDLAGCLRITCPGDSVAFVRLAEGLRDAVSFG